MQKNWKHIQRKGEEDYDRGIKEMISGGGYWDWSGGCANWQQQKRILCAFLRFFALVSWARYIYPRDQPAWNSYFHKSQKL